MDKSREKAQVMSAEEIRRCLVRISHEILERDQKVIRQLALIGIRRGGDHLARRIASTLESVEDLSVPFGVIDTLLYRDDLNLHHTNVKANQTDIPFDVTGKQVVLVDDVLYTGRTARAGKSGLCITLFNRNNEEYLHKAEELAGIKIERVP